MKSRTRSEIEEALDLAEANRDEAPQGTINRLRYCFPDLGGHALRAMALKHPDVIRERIYWTRRIRAHRRALAACKARGKART
jgi:hypothetical protein